MWGYWDKILDFPPVSLLWFPIRTLILSILVFTQPLPLPLGLQSMAVTWNSAFSGTAIIQTIKTCHLRFLKFSDHPFLWTNMTTITPAWMSFYCGWLFAFFSPRNFHLLSQSWCRRLPVAVQMGSCTWVSSNFISFRLLRCSATTKCRFPDRLHGKMLYFGY